MHILLLVPCRLNPSSVMFSYQLKMFEKSLPLLVLGTIKLHHTDKTIGFYLHFNDISVAGPCHGREPFHVALYQRRKDCVCFVALQTNGISL